MQQNNPNTIKLFQPDDTELKNAVLQLHYYSVDQLKPWSEIIRDAIGKKAIEVEGKTSVVNAYLNEFMTKKSPNKLARINFLALFWSDARNYRCYLDTLPPQVQEVWRIIIKNNCISNRHAEKISGEKFFHTQTHGWYSSYNIYTPTRIGSQFLFIEEGAEFRFRTFYSDNVNLFLPVFLSRRLIPWMRNKSYDQLPSYTTLPEKDQNLKRFNAEPFLFVELQLLSNWQKQGKLEVNDKYKLMASQVKQAIKTLNPVKFFETDDAIMKDYRAQLLIQAIALHLHIHPKDSPSPEMVKKLFTQTIVAYLPPIFTLLLPHVAGLKLSSYKYITSYDTCIDIFPEKWIKSKLYDWIDVDDLFYHFQYKERALHVRLEHKPEDYTNKWTNDLIDSESYHHSITLALYKGYFFLMAAFGLLEIAFEELDIEKQETPLDTLRYIKLTELGLYVYGVKKNYELKSRKEDELPYFRLDDQLLIVQSLRDDNPYEAFLSSIAEPIGSKRYRVKSLSILSNCKTEKDVEDVIHFFKQFISKEPPAIWKDFFQSLLRHANPLQKIPADKYKVYQLDPKNE